MANKIIEPGIRIRITPRGRFYQVRLKDKYGKWFPSRMFERLSDARHYKSELLSSRMSYRAAERVQKGNMRFADYWLLWLNECRGGVSTGWRNDQERMGKRYILPFIANIPLREVCSRDIGNIIESARRLGRGPGQLRHIYNCIHRAFEDAIEHFEFVDRSPVIRRYCPKVPRKNRNFLHPVDVAKLLNHAKGHWLEPALMLGLFAGLRPSEIQALTWRNVDLEKAQIRICAAFKRRNNRIEPFPKQKNHGLATIPKPLYEYLGELGAGKSPDEFVAPGERGGMLNYLMLHRLLPQLCDAVGVIRITPHELRHSCTELWVFNGANKEDCGRQLNHANASTTERYMHRTSDRLTAIGSNFVLPGYGTSKPTLRVIRPIEG